MFFLILFQTVLHCVSSLVRSDFGHHEFHCYLSAAVQGAWNSVFACSCPQCVFHVMLSVYNVETGHVTCRELHALQSEPQRELLQATSSRECVRCTELRQ